MGYDYNLSITAFKAKDAEACIAEIQATEPDIGDLMVVTDDHVVFLPDEPYGRWCSAEDKAADIIAKHIQPGTTCRVEWDGEDGEAGGKLIGLNRVLEIVYEPLAVTETGNIPLHLAEKMLVAGTRFYFSTWNYHDHGEHQFYSMSNWQYEVANKDTVLGYQEWVEHKLDSLLDDIDLDGVDAIEVAGCIEIDGIVEVTAEREEDAKFFSVYTHRPNQGVECHCDFNTKDQAVAFAKSLAAKTDIPVYGNCCNIEEVENA